MAVIYAPGTASTLKNGDRIQLGTDSQVAVEVRLVCWSCFLQCHLYLMYGFALDGSTSMYQAGQAYFCI